MVQKNFHYEVMIILHPERSEQAGEMLKRLCEMLTSRGAVVHRAEDCGRRKLAYEIQSQFKGHYILVNFEGNNSLVEFLRNSFKYNDAIMRYLITKRDKAYVKPTALRLEEERDEKVRLTSGDEVLDYKNVYYLREFMMETARIVPSRVSGLSARGQRSLSYAIRLARQMALLPYCDAH